jgi:molybdenum cofactor synthesis domain-containing protein
VLKIAVITVSDRASRGEYRDLSGPRIREIILENIPGAEVTLEVVPDDRELLRKTIESRLGADYILTTGGTGPSPLDITPEVTAAVCERELPGVSEYLRMKSAEETPCAVFSRAFSGIRGSTILVNFPGSVKAVTLCASLLLPVMEHGAEMLRGGGH